MAFDAKKYVLEDWLTLEKDNILQKICDIRDADGRLLEQRKTRIYVVPVGEPVPDGSGRISNSAPSLRRFFVYDDLGNQFVTLPDMAEWTVECEAICRGSVPDTADTTLIPYPVKVIPVSLEYGEASSVPIGVETLVLRKTFEVDDVAYVRTVDFSGDNRAYYYIKIDGEVKKKGRLWWCDFTDFTSFTSSNGGVRIEDAVTVEITVVNLGKDLADFNATLSYTMR